MIRRYYTVYEEKSETIIAYGTAEECAGQLSIKRSSFMVVSKGETICHGIMHGTMSDGTGGKIAMVTPSFYLCDLLNN